MRRMPGYDRERFRLRPRPDRDLREEMARSYQMATRWTLKMMEIVVEVERSELYLEDGCTHTSQWLSTYLGMGYRRAQEFVEVALALRRLPHMKKAYEEGRISYDHLRALVQVAGEENEADLLQAVEGTGVADTYRMVKRIHGVSKEDSREARGQRWVEMSWDHDSRLLMLYGLFPEEEGVRLEKAIDRLALKMPEDPSFQDLGSKTPMGVRRADALAALAASSLSSSSSPSSEVVVHIDIEDLISGHGVAEIDPGVFVSPETARRLLCDGFFQVVADDRSSSAWEPVWEGVRKRSLSRKTRRLVHRRDKRCTFPGCRGRKQLQVHHEVPGNDDPRYLRLLCPNHHWFVHEFGYRIAGTPPHVYVERPTHRPIRVGPPWRTATRRKSSELSTQRW
jgi:hypothetical protein